MLKKVFKWTFLLIIIPVILLLVAGYFFRKPVKEAVVSALNNQLNTEVTTEEISISLFSHFPNVTVVFTNVRVKESPDLITTGTVLNAAKLSVVVNIFDVIAGEVKISKLEVIDGTLNLQECETANNYTVWKQGEQSGDSKIELNDVVMKNLHVVYYNTLVNNDLDCFIVEGSLSGNFSDQQYSLKAELQTTQTFFKSNGVSYVNGKDVRIDAVLEVDRTNNVYTFSKSRVMYAGLDVVLDGSIEKKNNQTSLDLRFNSHDSDLRAIFAFLPESVNRKAASYHYTGAAGFSCTIKGPASQPLINATFNAKNAGLNPRGTDYKLEKMNFTGSFTNYKSKKEPYEYLSISDLHGLLQGKPITLNLEVTNFIYPTVNFQSVADADLNVVSKFYCPDSVYDVSGHVRLDISFKGRPGELQTYQSSGELLFDKVGFRIKGRPIEFSRFSGSLQLSGGDLVAKNVAGMAGSTDIAMEGIVKDFAGYVLAGHKPLSVSSKLKSSRLHIDELIAHDQTAADSMYAFKPVTFVNMDLEVDADSLWFRKFKATDVNCQLLLHNGILTTRDLTMSTCGGKIALRGKIDDTTQDSLQINYDAKVLSINISQLFYEMGNFGQEVLTNKHLKGNVTADVIFKSMWTNTLQVNPDQIYAKGDITIASGELNNFEPMLALSKYIKGTDLNHISFSELTNVIEIKDQKVWIPQMEIKSSALDLTLSGNHGFDNIVDYKIQLYLSQLTGKKVKSLNTEFGTIEEDGFGRSRLFLTMKGPVSDPKFKMDRKSVEKKISGEIKNEVKSIRETIRKEFGKKTDDTTTVAPKKKKEELQIEFEE